MKLADVCSWHGAVVLHPLTWDIWTLLWCCAGGKVGKLRRGSWICPSGTEERPGDVHLSFIKPLCALSRLGAQLQITNSAGTSQKGSLKPFCKCALEQNAAPVTAGILPWSTAAGSEESWRGFAVGVQAGGRACNWVAVMDPAETGIQEPVSPSKSQRPLWCIESKRLPSSWVFHGQQAPHLKFLSPTVQILLFGKGWQWGSGNTDCAVLGL